MVPCPVALALSVCEKVIVEEKTKNVTLVNCFSRMVAGQFPTGPQRFAVYAALRDGLGSGRIQLVITRSETDEEIYGYHGAVDFPDRLAEVRVLMRIGQCSFPASGRYLLTLLVDAELIAQREIEVVANEEQP